MVKASRGSRPVFRPPRRCRGIARPGARAAAKAAGIARARAERRAREDAEAAEIIARRPADYFERLDELKAEWKKACLSGLHTPLNR